MLGKSVRSFTFLAGLVATVGSSAALLNCSSDASNEEISEADVTGVNNTLGLSLLYDADSGKVRASVRGSLSAGEELYLRVRRGTIQHDSEKNLDCSELARAPAVTSSAQRIAGKTLYEGPAVSKEILGLVGIYNDPRWYGGRETPEMTAEIQKGPDPIVEACVVREGKVRARLLTNLAYAWDRGNDLTKQVGRLGSASFGGGLHIRAGDAGAGGGAAAGGITAEQAPIVITFVNNPETTLAVLDDAVGLDRRAAAGIIAHRAGPDGIYGGEGGADDDKFDDIAELDAISRIGASALKRIRDYAVAHDDPGLREGERYSTIDYANLCTQQLGEIPFFKKLANGKYDSFDCRDFVGSDEAGNPTGAIAGVEGATIPLTVNDVEQTECNQGDGSRASYDCVDKCDKAMWLTASSHTGLGQKAACQPGVTVTTAKNDKGTHWILLCRKVQNRDGVGMMRTKTFNDIAIIGSNPQTGNTCFFQNKENVGNDGSRVTHPADVARSSAIWPSEPSSYCTKNCHTADPFVHSPWIDSAKRGDGSPIVPKIGEHPDYPVSDLTRPYRLINGPAQGFGTSPQLVSEDVAICTTCHRVAGAAFAEFANWSTGTGDAYYGKITDSYKSFEKSHWMPPRLDGLTAENFPESVWGKAVTHINTCTSNPNAEGCEFAEVPEQQ